MKTHEFTKANNGFKTQGRQAIPVPQEELGQRTGVLSSLLIYDTSLHNVILLSH